MYKLTRRSNFLVPFLVILGVGIGASIWIPNAFPATTAELPAFALVPGEIAIALIFSVLLFENAAPADIIKLAGFILALTAIDGVCCNLLGVQATSWASDGALRLNWIQLIAWNLTGLGATLAWYTTETEEDAAMRVAREREERGEKAEPVRETPTPVQNKEPAPSKIDFTPEKDAGDKVKEKEILQSLDVDRINKLEESINVAPEKVSLESLFAEDSQSPQRPATRDEAPPAPIQAPEPVRMETRAPEPVIAPAPVDNSLADSFRTFELDLDEPEPEPAPAPAPTFAKPEPFRAPEPTPAPAPAPLLPPATGILGDVSGDLDDIFSDLAPAAAQKDFGPVAQAPAPTPAPVQPEPVAFTPAPEPPAPAPAPAQSGLLNVSDNELTDLFDNLLSDDAKSKNVNEPVIPAVTPAPEPVVAPPPAQPVAESTPEPVVAPEPPAAQPEPQAPAPAPAQPAAASVGPKMTDAGSQAATAVKEFGKLAVAAGKVENAAGTLKTIGQMLLDTKAVEKILKAADKQETGAKWRILTVDRGADLQAMMNRLAEFSGVESALLIGKDGLLLGNTDSVSAMKYVYGPLSLAMHSTTNLGTAKLQMGELRQAVLKSGDNVNILTDVGSGILAVFGKWDVSKIDPLLDLINTVAGGGQEMVTEQEGAPLLAEEPAPAPAPEPAPAPAPAPAAPAPAQTAPASGGLLNVSDGEVADLFDNLMDKGPAAPAPAPAAPQPVAAAAPAAADQGKLLNVSDGEVADLFDNLLGDDASEKKAMDFSPKAEPVAAEAKPVEKLKDSKPPQQIKEFGKLSAQALSKPDASKEEGAMKSIGRQLIDVQAVENIIKSGEKREKIGSGLTTARVISAARGEGIKTLLSKIDTYEGVVGSLIVGHDGLVIASTLQGGIDKDMMGALCSALHSHLDVAAKKLDKGKLQQVVFLGTGDKLTVLTAVAVGILAVFVDQCDLGRVDGLLGAIETTVKG